MRKSAYELRGYAMKPRKDAIQAIREAALKPGAADAYPYLPAWMWTAASRLAELVARYRGISAGAVDRLHRVLSDRGFMFRGGGQATA
jgi:hypothetical protein